MYSISAVAANGLMEFIDLKITRTLLSFMEVACSTNLTSIDAPFMAAQSVMFGGLL